MRRHARRPAARLLPVLLLLVLLLGALPAPAEAPAGLGPLAPHVELAPEGSPWRVAEEGGALVAENRTAPGDVRYWFVEPTARPLAVSATVRAEGVGGGKGPGGAGLLYGLVRPGGTPTYHAFVLEPGGGMVLYRRNPKGFERLAQLRPKTPLGDRAVTLGIRETAAGLELLVQGQRIGTLALDGPKRGGVGVVALGTGRFTFERFELAVAGKD